MNDEMDIIFGKRELDNGQIELAVLNKQILVTTMVFKNQVDCELFINFFENIVNRIN